MFINQKNGTFEEQGLVGRGLQRKRKSRLFHGLDAKDFNNDGKVDIFYNNLMGQVWAAVAKSWATCSSSIRTLSKVQKLSMPFSGWSSGFIDYNNDGWKDIYSSNGDVDMVNDKSPQHDTIFENVDGKIVCGCLRRAWAKDFLRQGLPARVGVCRSE